MDVAELVAARLRGEAWPMLVRWRIKGQKRWKSKMCWTIKGTTHTLYLPRDAERYRIHFAGGKGRYKNPYTLGVGLCQWWESDLDGQPWNKGPWYPEPLGQRGAMDPQQQTHLRVERGGTQHVKYEQTDLNGGLLR